MEWNMVHGIGTSCAGNAHVRLEEGNVASAARPRRGALLYSKLLPVLVGCLAASFAWGKSFSIDLRQPVTSNAVRAMAQVKTAAVVSENADFLRKVNLDAGTADVGEVAVGDELAFTLFDDVAVTLTLKKQMPSPLGGDVFLAEASGYEGIKNAVVLRTEAGLTVDIQDYLNKKAYKVISTATGVTVQEMEAKCGMCGCDAREPSNQAGTASSKPQKAKKVVASKGTESDETCVDILVAYDKNAAAWANANGGGITNFAQMAVQKMNTVLVNNGLDWYFQFRLIGVTSVAASSADLDYVLDAATDGYAGWDSICATRDEVGADIVTVLIDTGAEDGTTGLGWSLTTEDFASFSESAYNVCAIRSVAQSHTMTHEVGHNMGCGHSDIQATQPGPQLYSYSAGYYFSADGDKYHTVMAYETEGPGGTEVPYFSSPNYAYLGVPVGDDTHDNTRTLANTYAAVAAWRGGASEEYEWEVEPSADGKGCVIVSVSPSPSGNLKIPATVNGIPVVGIGYRAFWNMHELWDVRIPDSVMDIGTEAFMDCESLVEVNIPNSVTNIGDRTFADCSCLASLALPDGLEAIGMSAFSGCSGLAEITIPASVTYIGSAPFSGCENLRRFVVADGNTSYIVVNGLLCNKDATGILAVPNVESVTIPDSVTTIGDLAFGGCSKLTNLVIGKGVTSIGAAAFYMCSNLTEARIPANVRYIGSDCPFEGCVKLERFIVEEGNPSYVVTNGLLCAINESRVVACPGTFTDAVIPANFKEIGWKSFASCGRLRNVVIPDGVETIGYLAFDKCVNLTAVDIPDSVVNIEHGAFSGTALMSVKIPNSVTNFGQYVFEGCSRLANVTIGSGVVEIGWSCFDGCDLRNVVIPDSIRNVASQAFLFCSNLTSVTIGNGVTNIEGNAFGWCDALTNIVLGSGVESIQTLAFQGCGHVTSITIPASVKYLGRDLFFPCSTSLRLKEVHFLGRPPVMDEGSNEDFYRSCQIMGTYLPEYKAEWESVLDRNGYWHWLEMLPRDEVVRICFDANGGGDSAVVLYRRGDTIVFPMVWQDGYAFSGWWTAPDGGEKVAEGTLASADVTYYAHWSLGFTDLAYSSPWTAREVALSEEKLLFVLSGADWCGFTWIVRDYLDSLGDTFWDRFVVYYCNVDTDEYGMSDGVPSYGVFDPAKFNCNWYDGLLSYNAGGVEERVQAVIDEALEKYHRPMAYTVTFNANGGSVPTATRTVEDGASVGELPAATREGYALNGWFTAADGGDAVTAETVVTADVTFYAHWTAIPVSDPGPDTPDPVTPDPMTPGYEVIEATDITAPYEAPKAVTLQGVVYDGGKVAGIVELKLGKVNAKKKTSKVSGSVTTLDGKKHAITAFNLTEIDGTSPKDVSLAVKDFGTMALTIGGTQFAGAMDRYHVQSAVVGGNWSKGGTRVYVDGGRGATALPTGTLEDLLPDGEPVTALGGKWKFAKATSVKWAKPKKGAATPDIFDADSGKGLIVDTSAGKTNVSGLKLTYTPKKGTFKGSFKVYALEGEGKARKLKKYTVNVSGVVVGGVGYGVATCKNPAVNWTVTVK